MGGTPALEVFGTHNMTTHIHGIGNGPDLIESVLISEWVLGQHLGRCVIQGLIFLNNPYWRCSTATGVHCLCL